MIIFYRTPFELCKLGHRAGLTPAASTKISTRYAFCEWLIDLHNWAIVTELKVRSHAAHLELVTAALRCVVLAIASTNNVIGYSALVKTCLCLY